MELDTTTTTTSPAPVEDTPGKVEAPKVEAPTREAAPAVEAPKLKSPDEYFNAGRDKKEKEKAGNQSADPTPTPVTPEKAPASVAVAAPGSVTQDTTPTATTTPGDTDTDDPVKLKAENAKLAERIQQFEQAREVAEVNQLTQRQQAELAADKTLLDRAIVARDRKVTQCQNILARIAEAESDGDYDTVKDLNAQYADAYDDAHVLENTAAKFDTELRAKKNYFDTQYAKTREADGNRALDAIFKPYGLDAKGVLEKVPEQYRNNPLAIADTALKTVAAAKDAEIADLKKQLSEVKVEENAKARDKWDSTNPAREPHKNVSGGASGEVKWSPEQPASYWFKRGLANSPASAKK